MAKCFLWIWFKQLTSLSAFPVKIFQITSIRTPFIVKILSKLSLLCHSVHLHSFRNPFPISESFGSIHILFETHLAQVKTSELPVIDEATSVMRLFIMHCIANRVMALIELDFRCGRSLKVRSAYVCYFFNYVLLLLINQQGEKWYNV